MLIIIKKIPGNEVNFEVSMDSTVDYIKGLIEKQLEIPIKQQKLVFRGKTLSDNMCLKDYDIRDGNKIHLFAVESNTGSDLAVNRFWDQLSHVLLKYYSKTDSLKIIEEFKRNLRSDIDDLSLDDIERLAKMKLSEQQV